MSVKNCVTEIYVLGLLSEIVPEVLSTLVHYVPKDTKTYGRRLRSFSLGRLEKILRRCDSRTHVKQFT